MARERLFDDAPEGRWAPAYCDRDLAGDDALPHTRGAFLREFVFDARRFRIPPRVAAQINPMHGVLLHAAAAALDDVAAAGGALPGARTAFALGTEGLGLHGDYSVRTRLDQVLAAVDPHLRDDVRVALDRRLAPVAEDNVLMAVGSLAAGRVMDHFGLHGPHVAVDAGGASGLAALDVAWDWLESGSSDAVLVGGASAWSFPSEWVLWSKARRLSATVPRPFDVNADGTLLGEGAVILVVQRVADALAAGRRIHAVVRGLSGVLGGRNGRVAAPASDTYVRAFAAANEESGSPRVEYIECHASGRAREDAEEIGAVSRFYAADDGEPVHVGSVKALLGELRGASGVTAILKLCLAFEHAVLPPEPIVSAPIADLLGGWLRHNESGMQWVSRDGRQRTAAVTACSDVGAVYHAIVQGPETVRSAARARARSERFPRLAIVGMGAQLAGAVGVAPFWSNALVGHSSIQPVSRDRLGHTSRERGDGGDGGLIYSNLGAVLPRPPRAPARYGLMPTTLAQVDPAWFPALDAAREAVADAGPLLADARPERVALVVASGPQREREYQVAGRVALAQVLAALHEVLAARGTAVGERHDQLAAARARLVTVYPPINEDTLLRVGGSALAAQVAHLVGAHATTVAVESACASSLAALTVAAGGIERGAWDVVVVGGVGDAVTPEMLMTFCAFGGLSAQGLFPFDERASGFVLGEGAAFLVLQRASEARARNAHTYAILVGCAGASGSRGGSSFAPDPVAQARSCRLALDAAGVRAADVDFIECHGTGTPVGDASEVAAYGIAYGGHRRDQAVVLGSSKSLVGHLNAGAGAVGVMRAALALQHRLFPPTAGSERPSPDLPLVDGPFITAHIVAPWPARADGGARRAAVSGFGLGGTSFHAVLEEWTAEAVATPFESLAPEKSPLLDMRRRQPGGGTDFQARLNAERELFLRDHLVGGVPALPGAFACELMLQAAGLALPGLHPVGLERVHFERLLTVGPDAIVDVRVHVSEPRADRIPGQLAVDVTVGVDFCLPIRPDRMVERRHYRGRVLLGKTPPQRARVGDEVLAATRGSARDYDGIYTNHSYCYLGPSFQAIRASVLLDASRIVTRVEAPREDGLFAHCPEPPFWVGPVLLDNYLQTAGTIGVYHNHCFPMPLSIGAVAIWERPRPGATVWVCATLVRDTGYELGYRIEAFDSDGHLHCRCDDFTTRTSQPFSNSELHTFYQNLTGGPPEARPVLTRV